MLRRQKVALYVTLLIMGLAINLVYHRENIWTLWAKHYLKDQDIIISLTTTPHRIKQLEFTMKCLGGQNIDVRQIFISVPHVFSRDNLTYDIPEWLENSPGVTILRTDDYGPATKILGAVKNAPLKDDTIIIALDDDTCYPPNLVLRLAARAKQRPNAAVGVSGAELDFEANKKGGVVKIMRDKVSVPLLEGFAGIAYRAKFFDPSIFEIRNAPDFCYTSDDVYISFHLALNNVDRQTVNNRWIRTYDIRQLVFGFNNDALYLMDDSQAIRYKKCITYLQNKHPHVAFYDNGIK